MLEASEYRPRWQRLGLAFNRSFEKNMMFVTPVALLIGFLCSPWVKPGAALVPWLFAYITFVMGLDCRLRQLADSLRKLGPMVLLLVLAHGLLPWLAYRLGGLLFGADSPYVIGLVLFAIIPLGVSSVIWVGMSGGNVPMMLSLIVIDSLLSPLMVPALIHVYFGQSIEFDTGKVMRDLLGIVVLPTIAGVLVNEWSRGKAKPRTAPIALPLSKLFFAGVIMINAAVIAPYAVQFKADLLKLIPAGLVVIVLGYALGWVGGKPFKDKALLTTMTYSSGMRNISLGIVIGVAYFEPMASIPVVLTTLIQQPLATLVYKLFRR